MKKTKFSYEVPELETFSFSKLSIVRGESCDEGVPEGNNDCEVDEQSID